MAEHQGLLPSERPLQLLDETGTPVDGSGLAMPDNRRLLEAYTSLVIGRRVNDQAGALVRQGRLAVYPSSHGQEACQTGAALALADGDWLFPTYRDTAAVIARDVLDRTALADSYQGAVLAATGALHVVALLILASGPGWLPVTLGVVVALVLLLQSRGLADAWQKLSLTAPACVGLAFIVIAAVADTNILWRLLALLGVFAVAAGLTVLAWMIPGRRGLPHWGRAAEIIQLLAAIAMVCLVFGNLGLFGLLRGIGG